MRFDIRTLVRTISTLAFAALLLVGSIAPAMAQGRGRGRDRGWDNDRRHHGWTRGRHRGWSHSARRGRMWRYDDNWRWRRRALRRDRREARRDWRRERRRNRVSFYGTPLRDRRTFRSAYYRRDRRF